MRIIAMLPSVARVGRVDLLSGSRLCDWRDMGTRQQSGRAKRECRQRSGLLDAHERILVGAERGDCLSVKADDRRQLAILFRYRIVDRRGMLLLLSQQPIVRGRELSRVCTMP